MSCEEELKTLAKALRKNSLCFKGWNLVALQAFIRDEGLCVYCGKSAMAGKGDRDHLLPQKKYPQLAKNVENSVASCVCCNRVKFNYDPSEGKGAGLVRKDLILKAHEEIERRKIEWEREFVETGKVPFEEAVAQYRKCKESATAA